MTKTIKTTTEEITNAVLHGIGLGLAIAALIVLIVIGSTYGDRWHVVGFSIYGATLIILYLASTLYHSFPQGKSKYILKIFDHSAIFLLIAGTYTPVLLILLRGSLGWVIFITVWTLAFLGILGKILFFERFQVLAIILYLAMGWLIVFFIKPLFAAMNTISIVFLLIGGFAYSVGVIFYAWEKLKYNHAIWHIFVLLGSVCHFFTILFIVPR